MAMPVARRVVHLQEGLVFAHRVTDWFSDGFARMFARGPAWGLGSKNIWSQTETSAGAQARIQLCLQVRLFVGLQIYMFAQWLAYSFTYRQHVRLWVYMVACRLAFGVSAHE